MDKQKIKKIARRTSKKPVFWSFVMHFILITIALVDISFFKANEKKMIENPPIFIDLTKVKIDEVTNLPSKVVPKKEKKKVVQKKAVTPPKNEVKKEKPKPKPKPVVTKPKPKKIAPKKTDGAKLEVEKKIVKKTEAKKEKVVEKKRQEKTSEDVLGDLSSLLSSIEENKDTYKQENYKSEEKEVTKGIEGGIGGDLSQNVSITDKDALISRIRACWNVEAGVKGADKIIVEIRAKIKQDGRVSDVEILDTSRYNSDYPFRTIADSARRAIYVCDKKGKDSPFFILSTKYKYSYDNWKSLYLRFSPIEGVGF